jgi:hypothetical protein
MFNGAHVIVYSNDAGDGWLIFALPPAEIAVHQHTRSEAHELYLMCDDIDACRQSLLDAGVASGEVKDEGWGLLSSFQLPGGGTVGFYQSRHARPN